MRLVAEDEYLRVEEDEEHRVLIIRREAKRFPTPDEMEAAFLRAFRAPRPEPRTWRLLLDSRAAPGSGDDETEARIRRLAQEAERRFALVVVVLSSAAGVLQGKRIANDGGKPGLRAVDSGHKTVLTRDLAHALALARAPR